MTTRALSATARKPARSTTLRGFVRTSSYSGYWLDGWGADGFSLRRYVRERYGLRLMWLAWWLALAGAVGMALAKTLLERN